MKVLVLGNLIKNFKDLFSNDGDLDRSSNGTKWDILKGLWAVSLGKLSSSTSASEYPITSVNMVSQDVDISIKDISQGTTAALWITDSGNWWGLGIDQEQNNSCGCTTCTEPVYNSYLYACGNYTYQVPYNYYCCNVIGNRYCIKTGGNCKTYDRPDHCIAWNTVNNCAGYNAGYCNESNTTCTAYNTATGTNYCVGYSIAYYYTYTCGCTTCYPQYVRLIQSVSSVVSTIVSSFISNNIVIKSLKTLIRGNQITAEIYENTNLTGKIGADLIYEPTGVALTTRYGIAIKPSLYNQGNTNGEINIEVR